MAKQTLKEALGADLQALPTSPDTRFTRAEAYFATSAPPASMPPPARRGPKWYAMGLPCRRAIMP